MYMNIINKYLFLVIFAVVLVSGANAKSNSRPDLVVKNMTNLVLMKLSANLPRIKNNPKKAKDLANKLVNDIAPSLDLARISWSIVGKYWRSATKNQKLTFMLEFRKLLVNTYFNALMEYTGQKVKYRPYRHIASSKNARIVGNFITERGRKIPLSYGLHNSSKHGWRVYDVTVSGVSLVTSYRSSFALTLKEHGMNGLIKILKSRNDK